MSASELNAAPLPRRGVPRHAAAADDDPDTAATEDLGDARPVGGHPRDDLGRPVERRRAGRATQALQPTWLDPEETPFTPVPRPGKAVPARLFSLFIMGIFLALLAWLILPEVSYRLTNVDTVALPDGVLTAQAVPLSPTVAATVEELFVDANNPPDVVLPAGTPVAQLRGQATDRPGAVIQLAVPFDARLASVDTLEGAVTQPGTPVATVYDPTRMSVIVTVDPATLERLRQGMRATLSSDLVGEPIEGTVVAAIPLLGTDHDPTSTRLVNVRIRPDPERISDLVPGIRFSVAVNLDSVPEDASPLVFSSPSSPELGPAGAN